MTPLIYLDHPPDLVIVASKRGTDRNPAWFHHLTAMTTARVDLPGGVTRVVRPRGAGPEEKAEHDCLRGLAGTRRFRPWRP